MKCAGMHRADKPGMHSVLEGLQEPGIGAPRRHVGKNTLSNRVCYISHCSFKGGELRAGCRICFKKTAGMGACTGYIPKPCHSDHARAGMPYK